MPESMTFRNPSLTTTETPESGLTVEQASTVSSTASAGSLPAAVASRREPHDGSVHRDEQAPPAVRGHDNPRAHG